MSRTFPLRRITIEGTVYRWRAVWIYVHWDRVIVLRVWGGDKTSRPLEVFLTSRTRSTCPLNYAYDTDTTYVLPHQVRAIILYARAHGWEPHTRGAAFCLDAGAPVGLDDLVVVAIDGETLRGLPAVPTG